MPRRPRLDPAALPSAYLEAVSAYLEQQGVDVPHEIADRLTGLPDAGALGLSEPVDAGAVHRVRIALEDLAALVAAPEGTWPDPRAVEGSGVRQCQHILTLLRSARPG
jgi:hypothetical protein